MFLLRSSSYKFCGENFFHILHLSFRFFDPDLSAEGSWAKRAVNCWHENGTDDWSCVHFSALMIWGSGMWMPCYAQSKLGSTSIHPSTTHGCFCLEAHRTNSVVRTSFTFCICHFASSTLTFQQKVRGQKGQWTAGMRMERMIDHVCTLVL